MEDPIDLASGGIVRGRVTINDPGEELIIPIPKGLDMSSIITPTERTLTQRVEALERDVKELKEGQKEIQEGQKEILRRLDNKGL